MTLGSGDVDLGEKSSFHPSLAAGALVCSIRTEQEMNAVMFYLQLWTKILIIA